MTYREQRESRELADALGRIATSASEPTATIAKAMSDWLTAGIQAERDGTEPGPSPMSSYTDADIAEALDDVLETLSGTLSQSARTAWGALLMMLAEQAAARLRSAAVAG